MNYFRATTDASDLYRPNSAATTTQLSTAVNGNLADMMRNATIFRVTVIAPQTVHMDTPEPSTSARDTYGVL